MLHCITCVLLETNGPGITHRATLGTMVNESDTTSCLTPRTASHHTPPTALTHCITALTALHHSRHHTTHCIKPRTVSPHPLPHSTLQLCHNHCLTPPSNCAKASASLHPLPHSTLQLYHGHCLTPPNYYNNYSYPPSVSLLISCGAATASKLAALCLFYVNG